MLHRENKKIEMTRQLAGFKPMTSYYCSTAVLQLLPSPFISLFNLREHLPHILTTIKYFSIQLTMIYCANSTER